MHGVERAGAREDQRDEPIAGGCRPFEHAAAHRVRQRDPRVDLRQAVPDGIGPRADDESVLFRTEADLGLPGHPLRRTTHLAALHARGRSADGFEDRPDQRVVLKPDRHPALPAGGEEPAQQLPPFRREKGRITGIVAACCLVRIADDRLAHSLVPKLVELPRDAPAVQFLTRPPIERHRAVSRRWMQEQGAEIHILTRLRTGDTGPGRPILPGIQQGVGVCAVFQGAGLSM